LVKSRKAYASRDLDRAYPMSSLAAAVAAASSRIEPDHLLAAVQADGVVLDHVRDVVARPAVEDVGMVVASKCGHGALGNVALLAVCLPLHRCCASVLVLALRGEQLDPVDGNRADIGRGDARHQWRPHLYLEPAREQRRLYLRRELWNVLQARHATTPAVSRN
jgi:hypothetical protein